MANTKSALKAARQSKRKAAHNQMWESKIKALTKSLKTGDLTPDILDERYKELQSTLDRAVGASVIHRNKADRIKSRVLKAAHAAGSQSEPKAKRGGRKAKSQPVGT